MESQRNMNGHTRVYLDEDETNAGVVRCGAVPNRTEKVDKARGTGTRW